MILLHILIPVFIIGLTTYTKPLLAVGTDVRWEVSPWSECQINKTCAQLGLKIRTVTCIQSQLQVVNSNVCKERLNSTPLSIETCVPEKCALERKEQITIVRTNWSQCQIDKASELHFNTIITRKNKTCRNKNEILVSFVRAQTMTCRFKYDDNTFQIIDAPICAKVLNISSTTEHKLCYEKCMNPCALTTWSRWKVCKHCRDQITKYKSRGYAALPGNGENAPGLCPRQLRTKLKKTTTQSQYQYKITEWKYSSILYKKKKTRSEFIIFSRNVTCIDREGSLCDLKNEKISSIQIQVGDVDCSHGPWGSWSKCISQNKDTQRTTRHRQYRDRDVLLYPSGNGKACGDVRQGRKCDVNAPENTDNDNGNDYKWDNGNWSPCFLNSAYKTPIKNNCSVNVSQRDVYCVKKSTNQPVNDMFCSRKSLSKPTNKRLCKVLCPDDCLYSEWSKWSLCVSNIKERHKDNINKSPLTVCPRITHKKACSHDDDSSSTGTKTNFVDKNSDYFWLQTSWSECMIPSETKNNTVHDCFIGTQMRKTICVRKNILNVVNDSFCKDYLPDAPQVRKCFVCPKKCSLTKWSQWYPECAATCNPFDNNQRAFTQRRRFILNHGNKYGEECPEASKLHEIRECPKCLGYQWVVDKWDVCTHSGVQSVYKPTIKGLQNGYQIRNVYCSDGSSIVADSLCDELKPIECQECHINWLVTCNIKTWSDWSECSEVCGGGQQQRTRSFTTESCTNDNNLQLNETRVCNTQACNHYRVHKGQWGACHAIGELSHCPNIFSGSKVKFGLKVNFGVKYRNITCYDELDRVVPNRYCEEYDEEVLPTKRRCIIPCVNDCRMSQWSEFTSCSATCGVGVSHRTRQIFGHASKENKQQCPPNDGRFISQAIPCKVADCFDFKWQKEKWDECQVESSSVCGRGKQNRTVSCLQLSTETRSDNCDMQQKPRTQRNCHVPCTDDCSVSDWSDWSPCDSHTNRTREIQKNGESCPVLFQKKECRSQIIASWKVSAWSSCFVAEGNHGDGIKTRLIECVDSEKQEPVHPKHCATSETPLTHEICQQLQTSSKCHISEWTTWSSCEKTCGVTTHTTRTRKTNGPCGNDIALEETLACPMLPCFKLTLGEWSKCKPLFKNSCGEGTRERDARCTRDDGNVVNLLHCGNRLTGKSLVKESCNIPCWNDCVLTEWSEWSECFGDCKQQRNYQSRNPGHQIRSRFVLQEPTNGGRPCSNTLEEKRTCSTPQCFTFSWVTKNGQYKCQRSDGLIVSTGCKLLPSMYECDCTLSHATCIQKQYCMCEHGYMPETNGRSQLIKCVYSSLVPSKSEKDRKENDKVSVFGIISIILAVCVGYCLLFAVVLFLYKRRNKKQLLRSISGESEVLHDPLHGNQHDRTRNLIRLSNRHSSCSSGISSTGMTDQTPLSSLQTGVDMIVMDSYHYDEDSDGILTML